MPVKSNNSSSDLSASKYGGLVSAIGSLLLDAKTKVVKTVNQTMIHAYWHIGRYIVEYEQSGKERAEYGTELLKKLSIDLTKSFGKGYSYRSLRKFKQFFITFSKWPTLSANSEDSIWPTLSAKSKGTKMQTASAQSDLSREQSVMEKLSWSHFVRLLSIKNEDERDFYLIETAENNWSVRELDREINSSLFERLLLSKDKPSVKTLAEKGQIVEQIFIDRKIWNTFSTY